MHLAEAYRSLARPSSALEPSHPPIGITQLYVPLKLSKRLGCKAYTWFHTVSKQFNPVHPSQASISLTWCIMIWTRWDLNPGPPPRKGGALPAELRAQLRLWRPDPLRRSYPTN